MSEIEVMFGFGLGLLVIGMLQVSEQLFMAGGLVSIFAIGLNLID